MRPFQNLFSKRSKTIGTSIWGVWLHFEPNEELPPDDVYECHFYFVYDYESAEGREQAESLVHELEQGGGPKGSLKERLGQGAPRVDVSFEAVSDDLFTLNMLKRTVRWYYDSFSLRDGVQPPQD